MNRHHSPRANEVKDLFDEKDSLGEGMFQQTPHDDKSAMSVEDKAFLEIMDREVHMEDSNSWVAPLPFQEPRRKLPNNRTQAVKRLNFAPHACKKGLI